MTKPLEPPRSRRYSRRQIGALVALVAAGGAASVALRQNSTLGIDIGDEPIVRTVHADLISPQLSPSDSDLNLSVFTDYRCPVCRKSDEAMLAVAARDGRVRIIFKEWPIFGEESERAATVALMADRQSIYAPVREALLRAPTLNTAVLRRIIESTGGEWEPIEAELAEPGARTRLQLQTARNDAFALGLSGTPGYLIGSILVKGALSEDELEEVLAQARAAQIR